MTNIPPHRSLTGLVVSTLFCWVWPLFQFVLIYLIEAAGYALKLGGALLNMLACGLSLAIAIVLGVLVLAALRREHAPLDPGRIVFILMGATIGASAVLVAWFASMEMFCTVGTCPTPH